MRLTDEGANELRIAIVQQAVKDYQHYTLLLRKYDRRKVNKASKAYLQAEKERNDAREFLLGEWCEQLANFDSGYLLAQAEKAIADKKTVYIRRPKN